MTVQRLYPQHKPIFTNFLKKKKFVYKTYPTTIVLKEYKKPWERISRDATAGRKAKSTKPRSAGIVLTTREQKITKPKIEADKKVKPLHRPKPQRTWPPRKKFHSNQLRKRILSKNAPHPPTQQFDSLEDIETRDPETILELLYSIGEGSAGSVFLARMKSTNEEIVVKKVELNPWVLREIDVLVNVKHPNIVKYFGCFKHKNNVYLMIERMDASLDKLIDDQREFSEPQIASILKQILLGLKALHDSNRIHCDLKSPNILVDINSGVIKLCDFGQSQKVTSTERWVQGQRGTIGYMSPETFVRCEFNSKADIWSLGIIALELAEGNEHPIFSNWSEEAFARRIHQTPQLQMEKWSDDFRDFLKFCLQQDPAMRPTATDLLDHPFIADAPKQPVSLIIRTQDLNAKFDNFCKLVELRF